MKPKNLSTLLSLVVVLAILLITFLPVVSVSASSDPSIELSKTSGAVGTSITISGYDFTEDYHFYIFFDEEYLKSGTIDDNGEFTKTITIPDDYDAGDYVITVEANEDSVSSPDIDDDYEESAEADFEIRDITIELNSYSGQAGDSIEIYGFDFTDDYYYYVFFDETYKAKGTISSSGKFTKSITVPSSSAGTYEIAVMARESSNSSPEYDDDFDESASVDFEIIDEAALEIDAGSGNVGDTFHLNGSGFGDSKTITVYWDETKIGSTFTSTSSGTFSNKSCTVPETYYGTHTIKAINSSGTYNTLTYSVTPKITLSSTSVTSGSSITVSGTGFKASSTITFYLDSTAQSMTGTTSTQGTLSSTGITVSSSNISPGSHVLKALDASGYSASADIVVYSPTPVITPTPTKNPAPVQTAATPAAPNTPPPTKTAVDNQVSALTTVPANNQPSQTTGQGTQTSRQPPPGSSSGVPTWAIFVITGIFVIIVILVTLLIIARRRKS
jgi:hypothetical protein